MEKFLASGMHWQLINFIIFVGLLVRFLRKPAAEFWKLRAEKLSTEIESARRLRQEIARQVVALETRTDRLDQEAQAVMQSLRTEGELETKKILEDAVHSVERIKQEASRIMEQEVRKAKEQLKRQVIGISIEIAERSIREKIGSSDQQRLEADFLKGIGATR